MAGGQKFSLTRFFWKMAHLYWLTVPQNGASKGGLVGWAVMWQ